MADMQNPGWQAGASRDHFGGRSQHFNTTQRLREQAIASRYGLSPWMAREVSALVFGEGCCDD